MELKWKLKGEKTTMFFFSVFYAIAGCLLLVSVSLSSFATPPHVLVLGALSLIAAYGLFRERKWSVVLVIALFFVGVTFGATTLYPSITKRTLNPNLVTSLFHMALIAYLILMVVATTYILWRRRRFL